jgi:hypothetical protein
VKKELENKPDGNLIKRESRLSLSLYIYERETRSERERKPERENEREGRVGRKVYDCSQVF